MRALVYNGPEDMSLMQVEDVRPGSAEVLIKVKATGICGSDISGYLGISGRKIPPMTMGHEFSGEVSELGEGVKHFSIGDRITVQPLVFCGRCEYCHQGRTNLCQKRKFYGVMDVNGSMAEYICVDEKLAYKLPASVNYIYGAMLEPFAVAYGAVKKAPDIEGKNVLVMGAGTIGLLVLQIVKSQKPARIAMVDINGGRLELAKRMGADSILNSMEDDVVKAIGAETDGKGVDIAFEVAGVTAAVQQAMSAVRAQGRCIWIGNSEKMIALNMQDVVTKELSISGTYVYTHEEFGQAIKLFAEQNLNLDSLISKVVPLEQGPEMFDKLAKGTDELIKVILTD